ncbi:hypothetical protein OIDMADRAFT_90600, partial [Oidiodendron maius Zn]
MLDLSLMNKIQARPPPLENLAGAFNSFFSHKQRVGESVNSLQAQHALRTLRYLRDKNRGDEAFGLCLEDLRCAAKVLANICDDSPRDTLSAHYELAKEVFDDISARILRSGEGLSHLDVKSFLMVLVKSGESLQARQLLQEFTGSNVDLVGQTPRAKHLRRFWTLVMEGFSREEDENELLKTAEMAEKAGLHFGQKFHEVMTVFYGERDNIEETKRWFSRPLSKDVYPSPKALSKILHFCIRNNELHWSKSVFRELLENNPQKETWDIALQWAAGGLGKGVEDVERMLETMIRHDKERNTGRPDASTINGLVNLAMSVNDSYLAERYIVLGAKFGIRPNSQTYILQMNYRISAGDLSGAGAAYTSLQSEEIRDNEDLPAINKYVRALCATKEPNYDLIMSVTSDLDERGARLEATTVSTLCMVHLSRGELQEIIDLLQTHAFHYSLSERTLIRDDFLAYCLNRENTVSKVWEAYTIFRQIFQETDIACFEGIASFADRESLDIVHNMLKMDSTIEPNTKLYNSLMLAYASCGDSSKALSYWDNITLSSEGPSYKSLEIVFLACRGKAFGEKIARSIWDKMRRMDIEITPQVFVAYLGALAGNSQLEEAKELVERAEKEFGLNPTITMIGTLYNNIPGQNRKDLVEKWAKDLYPAIWVGLEGFGQLTAKEGHRLFRMPKEEIKA